MMDNHGAIDEYNETSQRKRPVLLTVLIILSGINIAGSFLGVINSFMSGPLSEEALDYELKDIYGLVADLKASGVGEQFSRIFETMIDKAIYINNEAFFITNLSTLIAIIIGAFGLFLMFKLKKMGFHFYIVYSLLPIVTIYLITPLELISTLLIILSVMISALFALLYGMNLKHMK